MTYYGDEAFPALSNEQWARLQAYGSAQEVESGALLFGAGEATHDLILVDSGEAEVVRAATARAAEAVVARFGTGRFVGELGLLTGQATYLSSRVSMPGQVHRISPVCFRQLMDEDPDLSDVILRALMARRRHRGGEAARSIEILGSEMSAGALALRTYAARQQLPHTWVEIDTPAGAALARAVTAAGADLPVVITPTAVLRHATPALLAGHLGLSYQPVAGPLLDLVIVGAGPLDWPPRSTARRKACGRCCLMPSPLAGRLRPARGSRTTSGSPPASAALS
jgi:thioredoxin reductase (NADPH)